MVKVITNNPSLMTPEIFGTAYGYGNKYDKSNFIGKKIFNNDDNIYLVEKLTDIVTRVIVLISSVGLLSHPRTGNLNKVIFYDQDMNAYRLTAVSGGGWNKELQELAERNVYPLRDDDNGTWTTNSIFAWTENENYGNEYWSDGTEILQWKSVPNGFNISSTYFIQGLSREEIVVSGTPYYTVFDINVYKKGNILVTRQTTDMEDPIAYPTQSLVVGACYSKDLAAYAWLVVLVVFKAESGFELRAYKTNNDGVSWYDIGAISVATRAKTSAYISVDGKQIVFNDKRYTINDNVTSIVESETVEVLPNGTRTVTGDGGYLSSFTFAHSKRFFAGMSDGMLASSKIDVTASFTNSASSSGNGTSTELPVYRGNPATSISITKLESSTKNCKEVETGERYEVFRATVNGSYCSIQWSGVTCQSDDGLTAKKLIDTCNKSYQVTAILQPQGISATFTRVEQQSNMVISGPTNSGGNGIASGQYTVSNAYGDVTWSVSCGEITQQGFATFNGTCGCSSPDGNPLNDVVTAEVTATDECGRTESITVLVALSGTWVSNNDRCCMYWNDLPAEAKPYVRCDSSQCYGYSMYSGSTRTDYMAHPGWGYVYDVTCQNQLTLLGCGPHTTTTVQTSHWECP